MDLVQTIFTRRSVRQFDMTPLDTTVIDDIKSFLKETNQIMGYKARFEVVPFSCVTDKKAPHYILAFCNQTAADYINVGFTLQKVDLYLQSKGIGSLWLGMANPKEKQNTKEYCIMMAFGKTDVDKRKSIEDYKRLAINEISNLDNAVAQAARVAPSAMNSQPWKIRFDKDKVTVDYFGRGLMKAVLKKKMSKIDIGIVTRHIELALIDQGKQITGIKVKNTANPGVEILFE